MKSLWQTKKLAEACEYIARGVSPKYVSRGGIIVLNQKCIRDHEVSLSNARRHGSLLKSFSDDKLIKIGDVLVNSTGVGTMGRVARVKFLDEPTTVDSHVTIVRPIKTIFNISFFGWTMIFVEELIKEMGSGASGQIELSRTALKEITISFPESLSEQARIVKKLDKIFEGIARAKENTEKNLQNARELFESYLQSVFENPRKDWDEKSLNDVCELQYGYTEKAKSKGDYRFVRITDTDENGLLTQENRMYVDSFKEASRYLLQGGDLLMARTGASAGNLLLFEGKEEAVFASYLIRMRFKKEILSKLYWYFSKSRLYWDQVRQLSAGSAQPQFNGGALKQIIFPFPKSLLEQKSIVKKLDTLSEQTKKLEEIYRKKLADLEELKKSVLKEAFSGKL